MPGPLPTFDTRVLTISRSSGTRQKKNKSSETIFVFFFFPCLLHFPRSPLSSGQRSLIAPRKACLLVVSSTGSRQCACSRCSRSTNVCFSLVCPFVSPSISVCVSLSLPLSVFFFSTVSLSLCLFHFCVFSASLYVSLCSSLRLPASRSHTHTHSLSLSLSLSPFLSLSLTFSLSVTLQVCTFKRTQHAGYNAA